MKATTVDATPILKKYGVLYETPDRDRIRIMRATPGQTIEVDRTYRKDSEGMILGLKRVTNSAKAWDLITGKPYNYIGFAIAEY